MCGCDYQLKSEELEGKLKSASDFSPPCFLSVLLCFFVAVDIVLGWNIGLQGMARGVEYSGNKSFLR